MLPVDRFLGREPGYWQRNLQAYYCPNLISAFEIDVLTEPATPTPLGRMPALIEGCSKVCFQADILALHLLGISQHFLRGHAAS
jgi:hypothetical protein